MELLGRNKKINLFKDEYEIEIDKNLLKYQSLLKGSKKINPKDSLDEKVSINYAELIDPDTLSTNEYFFLKDETKERIMKQVSTLKGIKDVVGEKNAERFNIKISSRLIELLKSNSSPFLSLVNGNSFAESTTKDITINNKNYKENNEKKEEGFLRRLLGKLSGKNKENGEKKKFDVEPEKIYELSVIDLFNEVKIISGKEREFYDRVDSFMSLLQKSISMRQIAQTETLISMLSIHIYESVLAASGYNHYIEFNDLITLQLKCGKTLDLDYIRNFVRVIPDEVAEKKIIADNLQVFDNYVILHYNPSGKAYKMTEEEKRIKKDPILFGVIYGSNKLYYIADWVDEYCDLTWDQVVEKLEKDRTL